MLEPINKKSLRELCLIEERLITAESSLVEKVFQLYDKPIYLFSIEDLRLMIGQNIGLEFLIPIAVEKLEGNPFVSGDYYYGDLLQSVLSVRKSFWEEHQDLHFGINEIIVTLPQIMEDIKLEIDNFNK